MQDDVFKYVNKGFSTITGYSIEEIMNWKSEDWAKTIHPEDLETMKTRLKDRAAGEKGIQPYITFRIYTKSGKMKWVESYGKDIYYNGRIATYSVILDINDKMESEEKFRLITENANDIIAVLNENFKYEYINADAHNKVLGYSSEDLIGKSSLELIHPDDLYFSIETFREGFKKGEAKARLRALKKTGEYVWLEIKGKTYLDGFGNKKAILVSRDITERVKVEQVLRESEEKFRKITEKSFIGITITQGGIVKYLNETLADLIEYSIQEVLDWEQNGFINVVHPEDRPTTIKRLKNMENNIDRSPFFLCRLVTKSGGLKYVNINSKPFLYKGKKAILTTFIDLTEKIRAEQKLKESEEKYRYITEQSLMGIVIMQDNVFKYVNEGLAKLNEYSIPEILSWTPADWAKTVHPEDLPDIMERLRRQLKGKTENFVNFTFRLITKSGKIKWIEALGKSIILDNKVAAYSALIDITEKKDAEEKLKESEEKFRQISEQALLGITIIQDGRIKYINEAALSINEYTREEVMSWTEYELFKTIHPDDVPPLLQKLKEYETGKAKAITRHFIFRVISKSGKVKWVEQYSNPIIYQGKNATVNFNSEITERIETQQRLKEALELETFFKNLFTHDINNVLNNIQSSLSLFNLYQDDPEKKAEIGKIISILQEQVVRGSHMVSNIRQLSEIEEGKLPLENVDAAKILNDAIKIIQEGFQTRIIDVKIDSLEDVFLVRANNLLLNVFENILNNAVKYNVHPIVEIIIQISKQHEEEIKYAKFEFMDNGIGIDDSIKKTIFKEGYKKEKGEKGLGFGLSLVKKIIENYKGKIWVEDKIFGDHSKGSNFVLLVPLY